MPTLAAVRAANATFKPAFLPTAVFVGSTSGIGQGMVEAFARYTNGAANIVIVGRNRDAAEKIIASFPKPPSADVKHQFVSCDATLMKNVQETNRELSEKLSKINYLVISCGILSMAGRTETVEGIDRKLALHYYARWKFVDGLLPLLQKAKEAGEEARVMTVLAAGRGGNIDLNDLGLKKNFSLSNAAIAAETYNDLLVKEFGDRHSSIAFQHIAPGAVDTSFSTLNWGTRLLAPVVRPFLRSPADCAEWMLYPLFNPEVGGGAHHFDSHAEAVPRCKYATDDAGKKLWEHTVELTKTD